MSEVIVIKRNGAEVGFNKEKIYNAIMKAMKNGSGVVKPKIASDIADEIEQESKTREKISISEIEELVYNKLISKKQKLTARAYEGYRSVRVFQRENSNTIDNDIRELIGDSSDYWKTENANKNPILNTTKRDYMAGIVSTDATRRYLLPPEIVQAHDEGIIHFHDADYFLGTLYNCCLVNLEDMLQNGTVISETLIEKPHSFTTACTIATQIINMVASNQYGGQTITLTHLAPFVDVSRKAIRAEVENEFYNILGLEGDYSDKIEEATEKRLRKEITKGIQIIQYQLVTLQTTNGQAPFITIFMYLNEARKD
jgi:ribonucleoside-triphosphate reductase